MVCRHLLVVARLLEDLLLVFLAGSCADGHDVVAPASKQTSKSLVSVSGG